MVCHVNVRISVSIPKPVIITIYILPAGDVKMNDCLIIDFHYLRSKVWTRHKQILILYGCNDVRFKFFRFVWIDTDNLSIVLYSNKDLPTTMIQK